MMEKFEKYNTKYVDKRIFRLKRRRGREMDLNYSLYQKKIILSKIY